MSLLRPIICTALLATLLGACKTAQFTGSTKSTGSSEPVPTPNTIDTPPGANPAGPTGNVPNTTPGTTNASNPGSQTPGGNPPSGPTPNVPNNPPASGPDTTPTTPPTTTPPTTTPPPAIVTTPPSQTPSGPVCAPGHHGLGARLAFLIDNSGSNSTTDCPSRTAQSTTNGQTTYVCGGQTNRESAVLSAFDILAKFAADNSADALGASQLHISSFPSSTDPYAGYVDQTASWVQISGASRGTIADLMKFTRAPAGATPYGAAMTAATNAFKNAPSDGRRNVAILVSDGQPTDRNPAAVLAQANALKQQGVTVIVLDYNGAPETSVADDTKQMQAFEASYSVDPRTGKPNGNHWYTSNYASFGDYIAALLGTSTQPALAQSMTSSGSVISVQNSTALLAALNGLVSTSTVACTP